MKPGGTDARLVVREHTGVVAELEDRGDGDALDEDTGETPLRKPRLGLVKDENEPLEDVDIRRPIGIGIP